MDDASSIQGNVDMGLDRVKELEAMVKKLTHENQKLLTKVQEPPTVEKASPRSVSEPVSSRDEDDLIPLTGSEGEDDEWLYISPLRPPTEENKQITPVDWMVGKEHTRQDDRIPSLDEVRKTLAFTMDEAEELTRQTCLPSGGQRLSGHNRQMHRYALHQDKSPVRPSNGSSGPRMLAKNSYSSPRVGALQKTKASPPSSTEGTASLRVQWQPQLANHSDEEGVGRVPSTGAAPGTSIEGSLRVKWDPSKAAASDSKEEDLGIGGDAPKQTVGATTIVRRSTYAVADIPISNWRPPQQDAPVAENPLKVRWNSSMAAASPASSEEDVSVAQYKQTSASPGNLKVKWNAAMASSSPNSSEEDISVPKVNWQKAQSVATGNDRISKMQWRASQQPSAKDNSLKVKSIPAANSPSSEEDLNSQSQKQHQRVASNPLKVKWNASMATTSSASSEEDVSIPQVNWRVKRQQHSAPSTAGSHGNPLKVNWKPTMATSSPASSEEDLSVRPVHPASGQRLSPCSSPVDEQGGHSSTHQSRYSAHVSLSTEQASGPRSALPMTGQRIPSPSRLLGKLSPSGAGVIYRTSPQTRLVSPGRPITVGTTPQGIPLVSSPVGHRRPSPARGGTVQTMQSPAAVANTTLSRSPSPSSAKTQITPTRRKLRPPSPKRSGPERGGVSSPQSLASSHSVSPVQKLATGTAKISQPLKPTGNATSMVKQASPSPGSAGMKSRKSGLRQPSPSRKPNQPSKPQPAVEEDWKEGCY